MKTVVKTLWGIKGTVLGEVLETADGHGFFHVGTQTEQWGFDSEGSAYDALCDCHYEWHENL